MNRDDKEERAEHLRDTRIDNLLEQGLCIRCARRMPPAPPGPHMRPAKCPVCAPHQWPQEEEKPLAWVSEDTVEKQKINGQSRRLWWENKPGIGFPIYTRPQPAQQGSVPEEWREALQEFVNRCDRGEARSTYTYNKFKRLLATTPQPEGGRRIKLSERLPTEADADDLKQVWFCQDIYSAFGTVFGLNLHMYYAVAENAEKYLQYWPEAYWAPTGLKLPQPPQEGE